MDQDRIKIEIDAEEFADDELFERRLIEAGIDPVKGFCLIKRGDTYIVWGL